MPTIANGKEHNMAYSLSRWTDLVATKWPWFRERIAQGQMLGIDPRTGFPKLWSLKPEDTLGLIFWTRDTTNLLRDSKMLEAYDIVIHFTLNGWSEIEHKAPNIEKGLDLLRRTCDSFGPENVVWRFSPVPVLDQETLFGRWGEISSEVQKMGIEECYVSFLQDNDNANEPRSPVARAKLLNAMAKMAPRLKVSLCNEDSTLRQYRSEVPKGHRMAFADNLAYGICEDSKRFSPDVVTEGCGCALSIDPFTINETCRFGCEYCYAADKSLAPKKKNTTVYKPSKGKFSLPVLT